MLKRVTQSAAVSDSIMLSAQFSLGLFGLISALSA
jgi:hypothetical protein